MKKIVIFIMVIFLSNIAIAQRSQQSVNINNTAITETVTGKWKMISVQPSDKAVAIKAFEVQGPGYGQIVKTDGGATVVSKIFAQNNNSIKFYDAEGNNFGYTIISLTSSKMVVSDGSATITFAKQ
jgi:hypothetical protein